MKHLKILLIITMAFSLTGCPPEEGFFSENAENIRGSWKLISKNNNSEVVTLTPCELLQTNTYNKYNVIINEFSDENCETSTNSEYAYSIDEYTLDYYNIDTDTLLFSYSLITLDENTLIIEKDINQDVIRLTFERI